MTVKVTPAGMIKNKDGTFSWVIFGEDGEALYVMFCAHCHGDNGDGKGSISHPVYGAIPAYNDKVQIRRTGSTMSELKDGNIYHAITYGLNAMGPHASQVTPEERWKIIMYINNLQKAEI